MTSTPSARTVFPVALLVTWIVWGTSFWAIDVALGALPPLLLMGTRFVTAGAVAVAVGLVRARRAGVARPSLRAWRDATVVGAGLVTVGMGAAGWASTRLSSGVTALLVASAPLWIAAMRTAGGRGRSGAAGIAGLVLGVAGVAVVVVPSGGGPAIDPLAASVLVLANVAWAASTLFAGRAVRPECILLGTGMQMLAGGALLLGASVASGDAARFDPSRIDAATVASWSYLVVAASLGGFVAYGWLVANAGATTASTHAFVNPLVAVALGAVVLHEPLGAPTLAAGIAISLAVALLLLGEARGAHAAQAGAAADVAIGSPQHARSARAGAPRRGSGARPITVRGRAGTGWTPAPTPAFAARRSPRPWQATDGMDALAIDDAFDGRH
ncbi:MAG: DMT(drug/metabolite transporter) superfamily permease [Thermoleophilia bacterium]|nr:DMT(drug/metabolite transporter) superfamily permease [Thermoleophilia bacterium]